MLSEEFEETNCIQIHHEIQTEQLTDFLWYWYAFIRREHPLALVITQYKDYYTFPNTNLGRIFAHPARRILPNAIAVILFAEFKHILNQ